jgi:hypothetical protein
MSRPYKVETCRFWEMGFYEERAKQALICGECETRPTARSWKENPVQFEKFR